MLSLSYFLLFLNEMHISIKIRNKLSVLILSFSPASRSVPPPALLLARSEDLGDGDELGGSSVEAAERSVFAVELHHSSAPGQICLTRASFNQKFPSSTCNYDNPIRTEDNMHEL